MPPYRQDLSGASGGSITGRAGGKQPLGAAAQRRSGGARPPAAPPKPAWQTLRERGIGGQGSAAANRALAGAAPQPISTMIGGDLGLAPPKPPLGGMASYLRPPTPAGPITAGPPGGPPMPVDPLPAQIDDMPWIGAGPAGSPGPPIANMPGGGLEGSPFKPNPGLEMPVEEPAGVDSNPFAVNGGSPSGKPVPPTGQAGRIAALLARIQGSGMGGRQAMAA